MRKLIPLVIILALFISGCGKKAEQQPQETQETEQTATTSEGPVPPEVDPGRMVMTASGLNYADIVIGDGDTAAAGQTVKVHYTGWLTDGTKFDSSLDRGTPFQFPLGAGRVIKGWDEGVEGMKVGGKRLLLIPPELGYGGRAVGPIPPNSVLKFEVDLLEIVG
jgi:FKBP-type peptidyl-prolyl cis-trans isomerase